MRFENDKDLKRELKAITTFVKSFNGDFKKLDPNDIDYKIYNNKKHIEYAEVKGRLRSIKDAYPLPVAARKLVKLADKRLNPVMIWSCNDGIIYCHVKNMRGLVTWGGRKIREHSYNDQELMVYFNKKDSPFKTIYFP